MLARENHPFGCARLKPSQASVPAGLTLASHSSFCFQCQAGSSLVLRRPIETTALTGHCPQNLSRLPCGFRGSAQHLRAVYSLESESPKFFADVDLNVARSCPVEIACSRIGRFFSASIAAASGWCFRWFLVARGCADHRSKLSHSWLP